MGYGIYSLVFSFDLVNIFLFQNATAAPIKRSNIDRMTNIQILFLFGLLLALGLLTAIGNKLWIGESNNHSPLYFHHYFFADSC